MRSRHTAIRLPRPWSPPSIRSRVVRALLVGASTMLVLAGCGQEPSQPTPTPPAGPGGEGGVGIPGDATIGEGIPNVTTEPEPPRVTLGDLAARMDEAWTGVRSFRAVYTGSEAAQVLDRVAVALPGATPVEAAPSLAAASSPTASPVAGSATPVTDAQGPPRSVLEVVRPDRVRQTVSGAGDGDHEAIVVGDDVFVRGPLATLLAPGAAEDAWLRLPADAVARAAGDEDDPASVLAALLTPPRSPLAGLPPNLMPQEPRDLGPVEVNGRTCRAWGAANTTRTGGRLDITIAIDGAGLPCSIETRAGTEVVGTISWEAFDDQLEVSPPAAATPVAAPAATPAAGRD